MYKKTIKEENKTQPSQINRYRAGQRPDWDQEDSDDDIFEDEEKAENIPQPINRTQGKTNIIPTVDKRLHRLLDNSTPEIDNKEDAIAKRLTTRREIYKSEVIEETITEEPVIAIDKREEL